MKNSVKNKLFYIAFGFVLVWTVGEVLGISHSENIVFSVFSAIGLGIWFGIHHEIKSFLFSAFKKRKA